MSCDCNCGCDNKYSGGVKCHPLIITIRHKQNIKYTCAGWNLLHEESPSVILDVEKCENCIKIYEDNESSENYFNVTYYFAQSSKEIDDCHSKSNDSKVVFHVLPPVREWNTGVNYPEAQSGPRTHWDAGNPDINVEAEAKWNGLSDLDSIEFEPTSNPNPNSDFSTPDNQDYDLIIKFGSGDVTVQFKKTTD